VRSAAPALLALLCACGEVPEIPHTDLGVTLSVDALRVTFGAPFELTVDRVWKASFEPEEWSDETLLPLVVRAESTERHKAGGRVLERRVFRAHAFEVGDVRVLPPLFVATDTATGEEQTTTGNTLDFFVAPTLDASAPGEVEFPPGPPARSLSWIVAIVGLGGLLVMGAALVAISRRRRGGLPPEPVIAAPKEAPEECALQRLGRLRDRLPDNPDALAPFYDEVSRLLRDYVVARWVWAAEPMTSEELSNSATEDAQGLAALLTACDLVRFARHDPGADGTTQHLDEAERFLRRTATP